MPVSPVPTHCPYCSLQCGMSLREADGMVRIETRDFRVNRGGLCQKGWTAAELLAPGPRLAGPLMRARRDGPLTPVSWDEALDVIAGELSRAQVAYGPDTAGIFGGGGLTNEKAYWLGKFARVALRTASIDYNGRFCMSSAAAAATRAFGIDRGLPFPLPDLAAADVILLAGSNAAETMPPFTRCTGSRCRTWCRHCGWQAPKSSRCPSTAGSCRKTPRRCTA
jgi:assimilatory nitrate reductase catalytic subunit